MPRVEIPLIGPSYTNREKPLSAQKAINMWPEINPEARNQVALHNTAGIRTFATLSGIDRGMHDFNNLMYAVNGTTLYSIDDTGENIALGTIPGAERCVFANDSLQLVIVSAGTAWKYTVASGVEEITDPDLVAPTTVAYLNNQFIFDQNAGVWGEFVTSSVDPELSIDALDFAQAESHPDDIIAIVSFRQLIYFYGSHSVEPWQNTGVGNPPFARVNSGVQPYGIAGLHAITKTDEFMYFLDTKRIPRRSNGLNFLNIGNPALGVEFAKYTKISDCIAFDFVQDNQQFVAFTFPTADRTWCFHEPSGSWFELSYIETGTLDSANAIVTPTPETPVVAPTYIGPDISNVSYDSGSAMTPIDTSVLFTGDDIVYSLTGGSWPAGISVDAATGIISGTPSGGAQVHAGLIVTATNTGGSADATAFQFTVTVAATYTPGMMTFDGSTGYYGKTGLTVSGNKITAVLRFNRSTFTGGTQEFLLRVNGGGLSFWARIQFIVSASDHATTDYQSKLQMLCKDSAGTEVCRLISSTSLIDGSDHVVFGSFDGDAGTAVFRVDGIDEDDIANGSRTAPTISTLATGSSETTGVGSGNATSASLPFEGDIGYIGYQDAYLTNYADFGTGASPTEQNTSTWLPGWGGVQPSTWNDEGDLHTTNDGSDTLYTKNGTVTGPA